MCLPFFFVSSDRGERCLCCSSVLVSLERWGKPDSNWFPYLSNSLCPSFTNSPSVTFCKPLKIFPLIALEKKSFNILLLLLSVLLWNSNVANLTSSETVVKRKPLFPVSFEGRGGYTQAFSQAGEAKEMREKGTKRIEVCVCVFVWGGWGGSFSSPAVPPSLVFFSRPCASPVPLPLT